MISCVVGFFRSKSWCPSKE